MLKFLVLFLALAACGHEEIQEPKRYGFYQENSGKGGIQIFGDSVFTTSNHRIKAVLEGLIGEKIKDNSVRGAWTKEIKEQYRRSRSEMVRTVIINGGGNDVFGNGDNCKAFNDQCRKVVEEGVKNYQEDFSMMVDDGVHNIIILGFHYPQGWMGGYDRVIDYTMPLLKNLCEDSVIPCKLVDPREKFRKTGGLLEWDGVHPNAEGGKVMAGLIYEKMK